MYTRAIYFKNGDAKTITEKEFEAVKNHILADKKWVQVQGALISVDTIARVDSHHDTAMQQKRAESTSEMVMISEGKGQLVDERRKLAQKLAIENAITGNKKMIEELEKKSLPMSCEESENGDAEYYLNEFGEKMYS